MKNVVYEGEVKIAKGIVYYRRIKKRKPPIKKINFQFKILFFGSPFSRQVKHFYCSISLILQIK